MGLSDWLASKRRLRRQIQEYSRVVNYLLAGGAVTLLEEEVEGPNPYPTKADQVRELIRKHQGTAEWGCQLVQRIIALKASFVMPKGLSLKVIEGRTDVSAAGAEMEFARRFFAWNNVNEIFAQDMIAEAELQGQVCVSLRMNMQAKVPDLRYIPWFDTRYTVLPYTEDDYSDIGGIEFSTKTGLTRFLPRECIGFVCFGNRKNSFEGYPACGKVLREMEDVDKDLRLWRAINRLQAKQTPFYQANDQQEASNVAEKLRRTKWSVGKLLVGSGEFRMVGPQGITVELLERGLVRKLGIISAATGVPPHFLGAPDLLANRATAQSTELPVDVVSQFELARWRWFWNDVLDKAIALRNQYLNPPLRTRLIQVQIARYSRQQMEDLARVWLPLFERGVVSLREIRAQCPDIEPEVQR